MLEELEDYRPAPGEEGGSSPQPDPDPASPGSGGGGSDSEGQQQQQQDGRGDAAEDEGGKTAKKRRKRGQKLSAMEFEASRRMARQIAECSAEEQADWLWASFQQVCVRGVWVSGFSWVVGCVLRMMRVETGRMRQA